MRKGVFSTFSGYLSLRQWGLATAVVLLAADFASKAWALKELEDGPREVIPGFFAFFLSWNRGMSFSFLNDAGAWGPWLLGTLAVGACIWFIQWLGAREPGSRFWLHQLGLGLLIGGALGNVIDRIQHGAVVDFLLVHAGGWYFPVFNIADSAITVGVLLLVIDSVFQARAVRKDSNNKTTKRKAA